MPGGVMKLSQIHPDDGRDLRAMGLEVLSLEHVGYGVWMAKVGGYKVIYNSKLGRVSCDCLDQFHREVGCKHIRRFLEKFKEVER
jgi:hypothetical protein